MHKQNISYVILQGFPNLHNFCGVLFVFLLITYCVAVSGNIIVIALVTVSKNLHSPMYFFIMQVSLVDILMTTDIVPNLLHIVLFDGGTISFAACISQLYVFANSEALECLILTVMSFDRYVAICNPLRYNAIISNAFCMESIIMSWLMSFLMTFVHVIALQKSNFCGPNVIDHFFCDFLPTLELSCSDVSLTKIQIVIFGIILIIIPFTIIIISYIYIITTILKIHSTTGRQKSFSTCSSHLAVVSIFFGSLFIVYLVPSKGQLSATNKTLSLLYTVVTPLVNPFIYSLRNKDIKGAFEKCKYNFNSVTRKFN